LQSVKGIEMYVYIYVPSESGDYLNKERIKKSLLLNKEGF